MARGTGQRPGCAGTPAEEGRFAGGEFSSGRCAQEHLRLRAGTATDLEAANEFVEEVSIMHRVRPYRGAPAYWVAEPLYSRAMCDAAGFPSEHRSRSGS